MGKGMLPAPERARQGRLGSAQSPRTGRIGIHMVNDGIHILEPLGGAFGRTTARDATGSLYETSLRAEHFAESHPLGKRIAPRTID